MIKFNKRCMQKTPSGVFFVGENMDTKEVITMLGDKIEMNAAEYRIIIEQGHDVVLREKNSEGETIEITIRKRSE